MLTVSNMGLISGCSVDEGAFGFSRKPAGRFGDFNCDAPWELIESAAKSMMSRQSDNVEFVLWTG